MPPLKENILQLFGRPSEKVQLENEAEEKERLQRILDSYPGQEEKAAENKGFTGEFGYKYIPSVFGIDNMGVVPEGVASMTKRPFLMGDSMSTLADLMAFPSRVLGTYWDNYGKSSDEEWMEASNILNQGRGLQPTDIWIRDVQEGPLAHGDNPATQSYPPSVAQHELGHYFYHNLLDDKIREQWGTLWNQYKDRMGAGKGSLRSSGIEKRDIFWLHGDETPEEAFPEVFSMMGSGLVSDIPPHLMKFVRAALGGIDAVDVHNRLTQGFGITPNPITTSRQDRTNTSFTPELRTPPLSRQGPPGLPYDLKEQQKLGVESMNLPPSHPSNFPAGPPPEVDPFYLGGSLEKHDNWLREQDYEPTFLQKLKDAFLHVISDVDLPPVKTLANGSGKIEGGYSEKEHGPQGRELYNISQLKLKELRKHLGSDPTAELSYPWWADDVDSTRKEAIEAALQHAQTGAKYMEEEGESKDSSFLTRLADLFN